MRALALAAGLALVACTSSPTGGRGPELRLNPDVVNATGAAAVMVDVLNVGGGLLQWRATRAHPGNPWLAISPDTGTAGQSPSPVVYLDPTGRATGVYRDTIVFAPRLGGVRFAPVPLPVTLTVGGAWRLDFTVQPSDTKLGSAISPAVVVCVRDSAGQIVATFAGLVTIKLGSGTAASAVAGCATFSNIRPATAGTFTLTALASTWPSVAGNSFHVQ